MFAIDVGEGVDSRRVLHTVECGADSPEKDIAANKDAGSLTMVEDVEVIVVGECRIDGNMDDAGHSEGHVDEVPFGAVCRYSDDLVSRLEAYFEESVGEVVSIFIVIVGAIFCPLSFLFAGEDILLVGICCKEIVEEIECTRYFHIE